MVSNLPSGSAADGTNSGTATHCYAVAWKTGECVIYPAAVVTAAAGSSGDAAGTTCYIRNKSAVAATLVAALAASATT